MERNLVAGALAGLLGGLAGGFAQSHVVPRLVPFEPSPPEDADPESHESADVRAARLAWERLLGREIPDDRVQAAGAAAHYVIAGGLGAAYGALAEARPEVTRGRGLLLGLATWSLGDEAASPLLGLSAGPTRYPLSTHAYGLLSNLAYGVTTEAVRRAVRGSA